MDVSSFTVMIEKRYLSGIHLSVWFGFSVIGLKRHVGNVIAT